ncbi:MAG TPA: rhodanese-like domain-containing protein [Verrucomicrobiota bacterium]|nr:rhodanese-like domain-containing protein [Verrucomicrobiota bacterium]
MQHSPGFLNLVNQARQRVRELTVEQARERLRLNPSAVLLDVREESEFIDEHAVGSIHLCKGIIERDIEKMFPDTGTEILIYCGGGFRSVLACESIQKMGYRNVYSIVGGYRAMKTAGWEMVGGK